VKVGEFSGEVSVGTSHSGRVDSGCVVHCQIFGGQIYEFSLSFGGHALVSCVRRQSLVLQPLSTVVQSLGDRRVAFTRLGGFRFGMRVRVANWVVFAVNGGSGDDRRFLAFEG
jgi:hypothetical protein